MGVRSCLERRRAYGLEPSFLDDAVDHTAATSALCTAFSHLRTTLALQDSITILILPDRIVFICDTYVTPDPTAEHIAEMTILAAEEVRRFGIQPKVALL